MVLFRLWAMCLAAVSLALLAASGLSVSRISSAGLRQRLAEPGARSRIRILDARSGFERETEGYVVGSELLPTAEVGEDGVDRLRYG